MPDTVREKRDEIYATRFKHQAEKLWVSGSCARKEANPENARAVMRAIAAFGAPLQGLTEADFHRPRMVFQIGVEPQRIDIISAVDGLDYADASLRAERMNVDGLEIKVLSLDDLIINKRSSGRPKDIADAVTLEKLREMKNG